MDTSRQLHERDASGWQRGLYDDLKHTFRAPIVNWIFRTTMANEPDFLRYAWGQVKPLFRTRAFGRLTVAHRAAVLDAVDVPRYRRIETGASPAEYRELRGQVATFDVVAPRLAAFFEVMDRALHGDLAPSPPADSASTAPLHEPLDRDRGRSPTLVDEVPADLRETVASIRAFHGLGDQLPSVYRCLAQWPPYLERAWADLEGTLESSGFETGRHGADERVSAFVDDLPYEPRLAPADLAGRFDEATIESLQATFREFNTGAVETVLPTLHVLAATVDADGPRSLA